MLSLAKKTEYVFWMVFLRPGFMVLGWFLTMVFVRFYSKQAFHGGVHKDMVFFRLLLPWPGHPWTPWVELHFWYSDWPQIPYINMTFFPWESFQMPQTVPGHYLGLGMGLPSSSMVLYGLVTRPGLPTVWFLYGFGGMFFLRFSIFGYCENDPQ